MDCLTDLSMFNKLYTPINKYDLAAYWRAILSNSSFDVVEAYRTALSRRNVASPPLLFFCRQRSGRRLLTSSLVPCWRVGCRFVLQSWSVLAGYGQVRRSWRNFFAEPLPLPEFIPAYRSGSRRMLPRPHLSLAGNNLSLSLSFSLSLSLSLIILRKYVGSIQRSRKDVQEFIGEIQERKRRWRCGRRNYPVLAWYLSISSLFRVWV